MQSNLGPMQIVIFMCAKEYICSIVYWWEENGAPRTETCGVHCQIDNDVAE